MSSEPTCYVCGGPFLIGGLRVSEPGKPDRHYVGHCREPEHPQARRPLLRYVRLLCGFQWQTHLGGTVSHSCGRWRWHEGSCECRYCRAAILRDGIVEVKRRG